MQIPRPLASVSVEEKCSYFDALFGMALQEFRDKEANEQDDDYPHYIFEAVMEMLAPVDSEKDFWKLYNNLPGKR